jgi:hypothetical protein
MDENKGPITEMPAIMLETVVQETFLFSLTSFHNILLDTCKIHSSFSYNSYILIKEIQRVINFITEYH